MKLIRKCVDEIIMKKYYLPWENSFDCNNTANFSNDVWKIEINSIQAAIVVYDSRGEVLWCHQAHHMMSSHDLHTSVSCDISKLFTNQPVNPFWNPQNNRSEKIAFQVTCTLLPRNMCQNKWQTVDFDVFSVFYTMSPPLDLNSYHTRNKSEQGNTKHIHRNMLESTHRPYQCSHASYRKLKLPQKRK